MRDQKKAHPRERVGFEVLQKRTSLGPVLVLALFAVVFFVELVEPCLAIS